MAEALALADEGGVAWRGACWCGCSSRRTRSGGGALIAARPGQDPTAHAEVIAIREAAATLGTWRLDDCTVIVTLEPCPMCAGAPWSWPEFSIVYTAVQTPKGDSWAHWAIFQIGAGLNHRFFGLKRGVLATECSNRLTEFFRQLRESKS